MCKQRIIFYVLASTVGLLFHCCLSLRDHHNHTSFIQIHKILGRPHWQTVQPFWLHMYHDSITCISFLSVCCTFADFSIFTTSSASHVAWWQPSWSSSSSSWTKHGSELGLIYGGQPSSRKEMQCGNNVGATNTETISFSSDHGSSENHCWPVNPCQAKVKSTRIGAKERETYILCVWILYIDKKVFVL